MDMAPQLADMGVDLKTPEQDMGQPDASDMTPPEDMEVVYQNIRVTNFENIKSCNDICAENGLSCDGKKISGITQTPTAGYISYEQGYGGGLKCDTIPDRYYNGLMIDGGSDMGGQDMQMKQLEIELMVCYCR